MIDPLDNFEAGSAGSSDRASEHDQRDGVEPDRRALDALQDAYIEKGHQVERPWPPKPGVFVVLWPLFLLIGGAVAAAPHLMAKYVDDSIAMPAIRFILGTYVVGLTVLLPMVRLSQRRSVDPVIEGAMDAFSLLLPLQPLLWFTVAAPISVNTSRVLAIDLAMVFWTAIVAGWVGVTLGHEARRGEAINATRRGVAMGGILAVQAVVPVGIGVAMSMGLEVGRGVWLFSPVAGVIDLAARPRQTVELEGWIGVGALGLVAVGVWWIALVERRSVLSRERPRGLPATSS